MGDHEPLDARLKRAIESHHESVRQERVKTEAAMWERLRREDRCHDLAKEILRDIVCPRLDRLTVHFGGAHAECHEAECAAVAHLGGEGREGIDARVRFWVGYTLKSEVLRVHFELCSVPGPSEFWAEEVFEVSVTAPDREAVTAWVEDCIVRAAEAYMAKDRTLQARQRTDLALDPVCGMRIPKGAAVGTTDHRGHRYYFCALVCQQAFEADPPKYLTGDRRKNP